MEILLNRLKKSGKAVQGQITLPFSPDNVHKYETLENADFLIPAGVYPLDNTWSPRFKKNMPLICDVPDREGIRFHLGSKPEHSQGCVLINPLGLENLKVFINAFKKYYEDETLFIRITDDFRDGNRSL